MYVTDDVKLFIEKVWLNHSLFCFLEGVPRDSDRDIEYGDFDIFDEPASPYSTFNFKYNNQAFKRLHDLMEFNTLNNIEVSPTLQSLAFTAVSFCPSFYMTLLFYRLSKKPLKKAFCWDERTHRAVRFPFRSVKSKTRSSWNETTALRNDPPNRQLCKKPHKSVRLHWSTGADCESWSRFIRQGWIDLNTGSLYAAFLNSSISYLKITTGALEVRCRVHTNQRFIVKKSQLLESCYSNTMQHR